MMTFGLAQRPTDVSLIPTLSLNGRDGFAAEETHSGDMVWVILRCEQMELTKN